MMANRKSKGRAKVAMDAASAWQHQQQLQQLKAAVATLPFPYLLPSKVAREVRRVMLLLQRYNSDSSGGSGSGGSGGSGGSSTNGVPSHSCVSDAASALDADQALLLAAQHIKQAISELQAAAAGSTAAMAAAAACTHTHLFGAWVNNVTADWELGSCSTVGSNTGNSNQSPAVTIGTADAAATDLAATGPHWQPAYASGMAQQHPSSMDGSQQQLSAAIMQATPAAAPAFVDAVQHRWLLSSYQYGRLLQLLGMLPLLLDQLAWLQLHAPISTANKHHQQQSGSQYSQQDALQTSRWLLLADVCCAVPELAVQLLEMQLPVQAVHCVGGSYGTGDTQLQQGQNGCSSEGSATGSMDACFDHSSDAYVAGWHPAHLCSVPLLCLWTAGSNIAQPANQVASLLVLCQLLQCLLSKQDTAPEHPRQPQRPEQVSDDKQAKATYVPVPVLAKLAQLDSGKWKQQATRDLSHNSSSGNGAHSNSIREGQDACTGSAIRPGSWWVCITRQQLLAVALQLLQDLLLLWGAGLWAAQASAAAIAPVVAESAVSSSVQPCAQCAVGFKLRDALARVQGLLQRQLPKWLEQPHVQNNNSSGLQGAQGAATTRSDRSNVCVGNCDNNSVDANRRVQHTAEHMLSQLPVMSHQLLVHTNSRLVLMLMVAPATTLQQQQQADGANQRPQGMLAAADWSALSNDPFGFRAQELLQCHCCGTGAAAGAQAPLGVSPNNRPGSDRGDNHVSQHAACTRNCDTARACNSFMQCMIAGQQQGQGGGMLGSAAPPCAAACGQQRLLCSVLWSCLKPRQHSKEQQQLQVPVLAPAFVPIPCWHKAMGPAAGAGGSTGVAKASAGQDLVSGFTLSWSKNSRVAVADLAGHLCGLAAAWLTSGYRLGPLLQPLQYAGNQIGLGSNKHGVGGAQGGVARLQQLAAATSGTDSYSPLNLCSCLLTMLLRVMVMMQQQHDNDVVACMPGSLPLLLAMLAQTTQLLHEPKQQQLLLKALYHDKAAQHLGSSNNSSSNSGGHGTEWHSWCWLRQQLSPAAGSALGAAASRGLVAASNKLVEKGSGSDAVDTEAQPVIAVVMPQLQQQAVLAAELSRALLVYVLLWPELTIRRLLMDGIQHRSQQPLVVQLLKGFKEAATAPAATVAAVVSPEARVPGDYAICRLQHMQQYRDSSTSSILLDQVCNMLLSHSMLQACTVRTNGTEAGTSSACMTTTVVAAAQQQPLDLTEGQRQSAVALLKQLLTEGLLDLQDVLVHLCVLPLHILWQQQQPVEVLGPSRAAQTCSQSHLLLLLQLLEGLLGLNSTAGSSTAAAGAPYHMQGPDRAAQLTMQLLEQVCSQQYAACVCPLSYTNVTVQGLEAIISTSQPTMGAATGTTEQLDIEEQQLDPVLQQQQLLSSTKWAILGLCCMQRLLLHEFVLQQRPLNYKGSKQAAAILEALVWCLADQGVQFHIMQADNATAGFSLDKMKRHQQQQQQQQQRQQQPQQQPQQQQRQQLLDVSGNVSQAADARTLFVYLEELQLLTWQQRLLLHVVMPNGTCALDTTATETVDQPLLSQHDQRQLQRSQHTGPRYVAAPAKQQQMVDSMLLPDSLIAWRPVHYSSSCAATPELTVFNAGEQTVESATCPSSVSFARQLVLDCCQFAACTDAHAKLMAHALLAAAAAPSASAVQTWPVLPPALAPLQELIAGSSADTATAAATAGHAASHTQLAQVVRSGHAMHIATALAAVVTKVTWAQARQGATLALGQFLPWAAEHQAARVLLRLLPALLQATLGRHLQLQESCKRRQQQQQQEEGEACSPLPVHQQQEVIQLPCALITAALQLVCRAAYVFLAHGRWVRQGPLAAANSDAADRSQAGSAGNSRVSSPVKQAAAEQCFRHIVTLVLHITGGSKCRSSDGNSFHMRQVCVQELCQLVAAVSQDGVDCSALQAVLLGLLVVLCEADTSHSTLNKVDRGNGYAKSDKAAADSNSIDEGVDTCLLACAFDSADTAFEIQKRPAAFNVEATLLQQMRSAQGKTYGELLTWMQQQLVVLPEAMQCVLVPAVVHVCEQQLEVLLGRSLSDSQVEQLEQLLDASR